MNQFLCGLLLATCLFIGVQGEGESKLNPCTYCSYCTFCDECKNCPCVTSKHLPNCKHCKWCPLCGVACGGFCKTVCPTVGTWVGNLLSYMPTSVHSLVSDTENIPSHESIMAGVRQTEQAHKIATTKAPKEAKDDL